MGSFFPRNYSVLGWWVVLGGEVFFLCALGIQPLLCARRRARARNKTERNKQALCAELSLCTIGQRLVVIIIVSRHVHTQKVTEESSLIG